MRRVLLQILCASLLGSWGTASLAQQAQDQFFKAVQLDDTRTVTNLLFRGLDPNVRNEEGLTGLILAARDGALKVADLLLSLNQTQIDARTPQDESALMMACLSGQEQLVKTLIAKGADVNKTGWTPLHYAATKGHLSIMKLLLEKSAYIDSQSPNQTTPLMMAAFYGTAQAVQLLIDEGADIDAKNEQGLSALDFANRGNRADAAHILRQAIESKRPRGSW